MFSGTPKINLVQYIRDTVLVSAFGVLSPAGAAAHHETTSRLNCSMYKLLQHPRPQPYTCKV